MRYRQIAAYGSRERLAVVEWSDDYDEYVVKLYDRLPDNLLRPLAQYDYYTSDEEDARETARQMVKPADEDDEG